MTHTDRRPGLSRRDFLGAAAGAAALAVASTPASAQTETHTVDMTDTLVFDPEDITVAAGDTVVWDNVGQVGHSVTAYEDEIPDDADYFASGGFDAEGAARDAYPQQGDVPGGESYEHTFDVPGTYEYFCIPHETAGMVGTVQVEAGAGDGGDGGAAEPAAGQPILPRSPVGTAVVYGTVLIAAAVTLYEVFFTDLE